MTRLRQFSWLNLELTSSPNVYPAPRDEVPQPLRSSGSDHRRSAIGPSWQLRIQIVYKCIKGYTSDLGHPIQIANFVDGLNRRREAPVHNKDLSFYERRDCQVIEHIVKALPNACISVLANAFVEKTAATGDGGVEKALR